VLKLVVRALRELYAETPAAEFGPLALKTARQKWVNENSARSECNRRVRIVRRIFKWAVSEELGPPAVHQGLTSVAALKRGRTDARELEPVGPVDDDTVDATLPYLNRFVVGLVEFQRLTGWAPNQLCHSYATKVRKAHGLEAAQVLLGHSKADTTQLYAERNEALAATVAAKIG
jgi:site-specific recombinase XerD